jgi:peptide/nickel transport system permease protein
VVVLATLDVGNAILTVAGLSFINFGVPQPTPEWGNMISYAQNYPDQWWMSVFPGLAIFTAIMGFNFFGDALRDALDPRTQ